MRSDYRHAALILRDKYARRGILVDSNLLVLAFVGAIDTRLIDNHKRLMAYSQDDYFTLAQFMGGFEKRFCIPNIMTEVSNLVGRGHRHYLQKFVGQFEEQYVPSIDAANSHRIHHGLTDAAIALNSKGKEILYLTDDLILYDHLLSAGFDALNFNHIRDIDWEK